MVSTRRATGFRKLIFPPRSPSQEARSGRHCASWHFVSSMGTTGTITGVSRFMREQSKPVTIVGLQPEEGSSIPGIRRWPAEYLPGIFNASLVDEVLDIHQRDAENTMRELAVREGIFCGVSSGGAVAGALRVAKANPGAVVVAIICDRGDRYLSTGVFGEEHFS
mgnify:CR=1 FL=1